MRMGCKGAPQASLATLCVLFTHTDTTRTHPRTCSQLTTFQKAAMYSGRRFWYLR